MKPGGCIAARNRKPRAKALAFYFQGNLVASDQRVERIVPEDGYLTSERANARVQIGRRSGDCTHAVHETLLGENLLRMLRFTRFRDLEEALRRASFSSTMAKRFEIDAILALSFFK